MYIKIEKYLPFFRYLGQSIKYGQDTSLVSAPPGYVPDP